MSFPQLPFCALRTRRIGKASSDFDLPLVSSKSAIDLVREASSALDLGLIDSKSLISDLKQASSSLTAGGVGSQLAASEVKQAIALSPIASIESKSVANALASGFDLDAEATINAIQATGTTLTLGQKNIINNRVVAAKSDGVWAKWVAYYGFVGGTAASHAINWKNPSSHLILWNGTIAHNAFGIKGDGNTGYGDTGIIPSSVFGSGNFGLGFYLTENKSFAVTVDCGVSVGGSAPCVLYVLRDNLVFEAFNTAAVSPNTNTKSYMSGNTSTTLSKLHVNGVSVDSKSITPTTSATQPIYVCAANLGSAALFSQARLGSLSINAGLTDAEETDNYISELAFQTALGRN